MTAAERAQKTTESVIFALWILLLLGILVRACIAYRGAMADLAGIACAERNECPPKALP